MRRMNGVLSERNVRSATIGIRICIVKAKFVRGVPDMDLHMTSATSPLWLPFQGSTRRILDILPGNEQTSMLIR